MGNDFRFVLRFGLGMLMAAPFAAFMQTQTEQFFNEHPYYQYDTRHPMFTAEGISGVRYGVVCGVLFEPQREAYAGVVSFSSSGRGCRLDSQTELVEEALVPKDNLRPGQFVMVIRSSKGWNIAYPMPSRTS